MKSIISFRSSRALTVKNYGNKKQEVRANLIVCEGQLVGGDVCSAELDGFMQGLRKK